MILSGKHLFILSGLLLTCGMTALCQLPDFNARLYDEHYGIHSDIERIAIDRSDFIWLGSFSRIYRFDGQQTREFAFQEHIRSLVCDMHNQIWANTPTGVYLFKNDYEGFKAMKTDTTGEINFGNVFVLPGKEAYLQTNKGLFEWNAANLSFDKIDLHQYGLPEEWDVAKLSIFGNVVFLSNRDSIYAIDMEHHTHRSLPRINNQGGMYGISDHEIIVTGRSNISSWCNFETGLILPLNPKNNIDASLPEFFFVEGVLPLDDQRILISSHDGMYELNRTNAHLRPISLYFEGKPLERTPYYFEMCMDREKNVWVVHSNGLIKFSPFQESINLIRNQEYRGKNQWSNNVRNLAEDEKGNLWIATSEGFGYWDLHSNTIEIFPAIRGSEDQLNQPSIRGLAYDEPFLIMGTSAAGVWIYNTKTKKYQRPQYEGDEALKAKLEKDFVKQIVKLPDDDYLIIARDCYIMKNGSFELSLFNLDTLTRKQSNKYFIDQNKKIWLGMEDGLMSFDSQLQLIHYWKLPHSILALNALPDGRMMLGTQYGLYTASFIDDSISLDPVSFIKPETSVEFIIRDKIDNYWIGSNVELLRYNPANESVEVFDESDNVQSNVYSVAPIFNKAGMLFIGGRNGINYFHPEKIKPARKNLQVSIMNVAVNQDDTSYYDRGKLQHLRPGQNSIDITFVAPYYGNTSRLQYRYKLIGILEVWKNVGNTNVIRFSSLPPGRYLFSVAASLNGTDWFASRETLSFNIAFPFYRQWWFILLGLLCLGCIAYSFIRRRIKTIRDRERIQRDYEKRIAEVEMHALRAQMNPHFMFNSLNSINNFILKNDPDNASGYLTKFSRLMRLILDNSRSEWIVLENELKALELYIQLEAVRFDDVFDYKINIDPGVDINSTYVPPMIIQPYVENAIWHGLLHRHKPGGRLTIRIWRDEDLLHIQVEDNGVGRTEAARLKSKSATTHKSHGLKITAERMDIVNRIYNVDAKVDITDVQGSNGSPDGTRVSLTLLDKMYDSYHRG